MIESLFVHKRVCLKQCEAPLLKEREQYLLALLNQGASKARVRTIACILLHVIRLMDMDQLRVVSKDEIRAAAQRWLTDVEPRRNIRRGKTSSYFFTNIATGWFRYHKLMANPSATARPFDLHLAQFVHYLTSERQFSSPALRHYRSNVSSFLTWAGERRESISEISLHNIEDYMRSKQGTGSKPSTLASHAQTLRTFFRFCESQGWSDFTIALGIRSPRVPRPDGLPKGPCWRDVRRLVAANPRSQSNELRARAVILLCSVYGTRATEIENLTLNDFDWLNETFTLRRGKRGRVQQFPIQFEVGQAILDYLQRGRPRCSLRNLFVSLQTPYRPLRADSVKSLVRFRMKRLGIKSQSMGSHSLRHACATQLLKKGISLKDIADFLGHRDMSSVSIYAKCDMRALQDVAAFSLAGVK